MEKKDLVDKAIELSAEIDAIRCKIFNSLSRLDVRYQSQIRDYPTKLRTTASDLMKLGELVTELGLITEYLNQEFFRMNAKFRWGDRRPEKV